MPTEEELIAELLAATAGRNADEAKQIVKSLPVLSDDGVAGVDAVFYGAERAKDAQV